MIEKGDVLADYPSGMAPIEDQDMVQAFAPNTAQKTLTQQWLWEREWECATLQCR